MTANIDQNSASRAAFKPEQLAQETKRQPGHGGHADSVFNTAPGDKNALRAMHGRVPIPPLRPLYLEERDESWRDFQPDKGIQAAEGPGHQWNPRDRPPTIEQIIARDQKSSPTLINALRESVEARAKGDTRDFGEIFLDNAGNRGPTDKLAAAFALDRAQTAETKMKFDFAAQKLTAAALKPGDMPPPGVSPFDYISRQAPMGMINPIAGMIGDLAGAFEKMPSVEYVDKLRRATKMIREGMRQPTPNPGSPGHLD